MNLEEFANALNQLGSDNKRVFYYPAAKITYTKSQMMEKIQTRTTRLVAQNMTEEEIKKDLNDFLSQVFFVNKKAEKDAKSLLNKLLTVDEL